MRIERVVITGGRDFTDGARIEADLRALLSFGLRRVAQGGNNVPKKLPSTPVRPTHSADALAWWAVREISLGGIPLVSGTMWADWDKHGRKRAGPLRNVEMLDAEKPDLVLAYPDPKSTGTWHCVREALRGAACRDLVDRPGVPVILHAPHATTFDLPAKHSIRDCVIIECGHPTVTGWLIIPTVERRRDEAVAWATEFAQRWVWGPAYSDHFVDPSLFAWKEKPKQ